MSARLTFNAYQASSLNDALTKNANTLADVDLRDLGLDARDGVSLANANLRGVTFTPGADATTLDLTDSELRGCDLRERGIVRSTWRNVTVHDGRVTGARFKSFTFRAVGFLRADVRTCAFTQGLCEDVTFERCDLSYTEWTRVTFTGRARAFTRAPLAHARFTACVFIDVDWSTVDDFDLIHFEDCHFIGGRRPGALPVGNLFAAGQPSAQVSASVETVIPATPVAVVAAASKPESAPPPAPSRFTSLEFAAGSNAPRGER